ncbi:hypothetical protein [Streptomyces sp. SAJ15]|uniref:hypothetical protein n=1 Tax=Streptomyces sp. SAJ15 TaxID=2011095 RepID=UPI0016434E4A|nr:hypothetical protein [Streptomyces sp. SAJ15]
MSMRTDNRGPVATGTTRREAHGRPRLWTVRTALLSAGVLFFEAALLVVGVTFLGLDDETPIPQDDPGLLLLTLPLLACVALPAGLLMTVTVVLPSLGLARRLGGRRWVVPAVAAAATLPLAVLVKLWWALSMTRALECWSLLAVCVAAAAGAVALSHRHLRTGRTASLLRRGYAYGSLAVLAACGLGLGARSLGLIEEYRPPTVAQHELVGAWTDGEGGRLRLASDGTAVADRLRTEEDDAVEGASDARRCTGTGTWTFQSATDPWEQSVRLSIDGCATEWNVGGTDRRPGLNHVYGDPDSPDWFRLRR